MHEVTTRRSQSGPRCERVNRDAAALRLRRIALGGGEAPETRGGHDQMPLRKVLYRHRNDVYDLPARVQRRGLSHSPCEGAPLLWHAHRSDRVKWARIHKHGAEEVCGFVV